MRIVLAGLVCFITACSQQDSKKANTKDENQAGKIRLHLLSLERKWLEAEFALDTAAISLLLDPGFISITGSDTSNKQQELKGIYEKMSSMRKDSIFLDSLKLDEAIVNIYENVAVVIPVFHTYKTDKGKPTQKRTRFYDVWINRNGSWKAVSSQGTVLEE